MALFTTDYLANKLLDHIRGGSAFAQPSALYVKLHTASPGPAGATAPAGNTTRHQATCGTAASGGSIANTVAITWTAGEITTNETYSHVSLWDSSTAGNCLWTGALGAPVAVTSSAGLPFVIAIGALTLSFTEAS